MGRPLQQLQRFFRELKRRKVYRVAAGYLVAAFVALQVADEWHGTGSKPSNFMRT